MAGQRQPIKLVMSNGRKHLTKKEIEERMSSEVAPYSENIEPPHFLTGKQKKKFCAVAEQLKRIGIMGETDADALARYIIAQELYEDAVKVLQAARKQMPKGQDVLAEELATWAALLTNLDRRQDRYFKQAQTAASALGLTISSRCRLVMPKTDDEPKTNKFGRFMKAAGDDG